MPGSGSYLYPEPGTDPDCVSNENKDHVCGASDVSPAGTHLWDLYVIGWNGRAYHAPTPGWWSLWFANSGEAGAELQFWTADDVTGWSGGATFYGPASEWGPSYIGNAFGSVTTPGVSRACITTASYATRADALEADFTPGSFDISPFSGRGPRLDGVPVVDVAAPGNWDVFSTARETDETGPGAIRRFGGTSAAAPHVAGAAALLLQAHPDADPAGLEDALAAGAASDTYTGDTLPDDEWGHGKLRVEAARAAMDADPPVFTFFVTPHPLLPEAALVTASPNESLEDAMATVDGERVDLVWLLADSLVGFTTRTPADGGTVAIEVVGRDRAGNIGAATLVWGP